MRALYALIRGYTASFRPPGLVGSELTITLPVPPPSTVYGLLAAALGRDVDPHTVWVGYRFRAQGVGEDLEKIITFTEKGPYWDPQLGGVNTIPIRRQFLYQPELHLYVPDEPWLRQALWRPRYPLLLGRSQDVAYVEALETVELEPVSEGEVEGVALPFPLPHTPGGMLYSVPTYFRAFPPADVPPRREPLGQRVFVFVVQRQWVRAEGPPALLYRPAHAQTLIPVLTPAWLT